jgi:hypothetical protein
MPASVHADGRSNRLRPKRRVLFWTQLEQAPFGSRAQPSPPGAECDILPNLGSVGVAPPASKASHKTTFSTRAP